MTIQWLWGPSPVPRPFGPGFWLNIYSTLSNLGQNPYWWRIEVWDGNNEVGPLVTEKIYTTSTETGYSNQWQYTWFEDQPLVVTPNPNLAHGAQVTLRAHLEQPEDIVIDADQVGVKVQWDLTQGIAARVAMPAQATLTTEQATQLQEIHTASFRDFGGGIISPISNLITVPPLSALQRWQITPDRTGEGILNPQTPLPGFVPHAIEVEIVSHPAGIGVDEGAPDALEITYVELAANWLLQDGHYTITDRFDSRAGRVMWQPQPWAPNTIDYYIAPGVLVRFWWIGLRLF